MTEGFLRYRFGGLMFGGAYFRNFTVCGSLKDVVVYERLSHMEVRLHTCISRRCLLSS